MVIDGLKKLLTHSNDSILEIWSSTIVKTQTLSSDWRPQCPCVCPRVEVLPLSFCQSFCHAPLVQFHKRPFTRGLASLFTWYALRKARPRVRVYERWVRQRVRHVFVRLRISIGQQLWIEVPSHCRHVTQPFTCLALLIGAATSPTSDWDRVTIFIYIQVGWPAVCSLLRGKYRGSYLTSGHSVCGICPQGGSFFLLNKLTNLIGMVV